MGIIAGALGWLLELVYGIVHNYGITIMIFTVIFKLCLYPLYKKQILSTAKMSEVQPKMMAIQTKYAHDREKMNEEMAKLYKEEKFNPMGGCLPMLIQMPIIFGLFALLRNPLAYIDSNEMIFAVHESFLWIGDLTQPDLWVFPIAAGIVTFISFVQTQSQQSNAPGANQTQGMMMMMKYVFPIMIVWMGRSFPAGLTIYWFVSTTVQIFFNIYFNRLRKKMKAKSEKAKIEKKKAKK